MRMSRQLQVKTAHTVRQQERAMGQQHKRDVGWPPNGQRGHVGILVPLLGAHVGIVYAKQGERPQREHLVSQHADAAAADKVQRMRMAAEGIVIPQHGEDPPAGPGAAAGLPGRPRSLAGRHPGGRPPAG